MTDDIHYLTVEGLQEHEERLNFLRNVRRQEVAERLRLALEEGGELVENAEYEDAKNEQAFIEGEIMRLEMILSNAQIIEQDAKNDEVALGSIVTVQEVGADGVEVYHLVGAAEANPRAGKISYKSPLGRALMSHKVGDRVIVEAPDGDIEFVIKAIE
ncbi:MAG: transcription elongation factor GreA [Chloroflexota bacterium]|jgi:transcription elongation factor GreA|nr:transcription elongation factor GreA [Anaerolineae bacterium]HMM26790.1 transcription elongation factor GreA [Aggregatilineaceae bacterium]